MDRLHDLEPDKLVRFLHVKKTELSCTENPLTLINQLRDRNLIPEDRYQKMKRMRSKDRLKKAFYEALDWLERERSRHIRLFWMSVFKDTMMKEYPTLQLLRYSLTDGSFESEIQLPEKMENEDTDKKKRKESSEDEEGEVKKANSAKRKGKQKRKIVSDEEEEQAGPSSPVKKKSKKICFSPLKRGEKSDYWNWGLFHSQLPVTCGHQEGTLHRGKLAKGEKCIMVNKQWFTPAEFEGLAGKRSSRNWRKSIRCKGTPLGKLIQEGHLKSVRYRGCKTAKKTLFPSDDLNTVSEGEEDEDENEESDQHNEDQVSSSSRETSPDITDEEEETEEQTEQQSEASHDSGRKVFIVTCGALTGTLHKHRFASGYRGKSIRTETSWMTPVEFAKLASGQTDSCWRKDIRWEGKPLGVLTEAKILAIHALRCPCTRCSPDSKDLENQKNDDVCCICKSEGEEEEEELVMCDRCPRSFHQKCHLPHVEEAVLGDSSPWVCTLCEYRTGPECFYQDEMTQEAVMSRQISHHMLVSTPCDSFFLYVCVCVCVCVNRDSTLWMCTFCVFGSNRGCYYRDELKREAAVSRQISQHMLECQYLLLHLCSADKEQTFAKDPTLYLSDYSSVIETPMWLGSVADKLQKQLYQTVGEFVSDVQLVFTNCASYNRENAEILATGNRLKELFDEEFKNVFNINE